MAMLNFGDFLKGSNRIEHGHYLEKTGFWGKRGAGCLFLAKDTKRICISHRSGSVLEPNTWGTWGGAIDSSETPEESVKREAYEEAGYKGDFELIPLFVFKSPSGFQYHNFLFVVDSEFTPLLNWETQGFSWIEYPNWPSPLHPGMVALLNDPDSVSTIENMTEV
jgi:8-oxo-dGTP pyrophosphatase MutT (NUDIX family)